MGGLNSGPGPGILLLIAVIFILAQTILSAPLYEDEENDDGSSHAISQSQGCYYNFRYYNEGERIITNEPCLNCTCRNRMFMCYLRVCPFTKGIGQNCTIEKVQGQCCPIITCPEVPVHLLTSSSTTELSQANKESDIAQENANAIGHYEGNGCQIEGIFYPNGAQVPGSPEKPCELCYCIRNKTSCIMQTCALHVDGCRPVYEEGQCFPVRYQCDDSSSTIELEPTTTYRPPPAAGLIFTTTASEPLECLHNSETYEDGARILTDDPCEHCYCLKGKIACAIQECGIPLEKEGQNCTALPPLPGKCCPDSYQCDVTMTSPNINLSTEKTSLYITKPTFQKLNGNDTGLTLDEKNKNPEANLKPLETHKDSTSNENLPETFHDKSTTKSSLTTKNYDENGIQSNSEKITEKYQTPQSSLMAQSAINFNEHQTLSYESESASSKPIEESKESSEDKNLIKGTETTKPNEMLLDPETHQNVHDSNEKLPGSKDKISQQQPAFNYHEPQINEKPINFSESDLKEDHPKKPQPELSQVIKQPSKTSTGHDTTSPDVEPSQNKDDLLLNKLHNIIQDVQAQVNEGKTTSMPEEADYGITFSNQKGHFTDKPDSLIHTQQSHQETQMIYGDSSTLKPTENYEPGSSSNNNDLFNKLQGLIQEIYQGVTSTFAPVKEQVTSSTITKGDSVISPDDHSVQKPSFVDKIPHFSNKETSKYPHQPDLTEQTTDYRLPVTQEILTENYVNTPKKEFTSFNNKYSIEMHSMGTNKLPNSENTEFIDATTSEIFTNKPSVSIQKETDNFSSNKITNKPTDLENIIHSTPYSFEKPTDAEFNLNTIKNSPVSNSDKSAPSLNGITGSTTKYNQKKKPTSTLHQGIEHSDINNMASEPEKESFLNTSEPQKYGSDHPNKGASVNLDNLNKESNFQNQVKPSKPFGQTQGVHHAEDLINEPENSTLFNHFSETGTTEIETDHTFKPNSQLPDTTHKLSHLGFTQNSELYPVDYTEGLTESYIPTHSEDNFPDNKEKPEITTLGYIKPGKPGKPEKPGYLTDQTEMAQEKFTSRPHDYVLSVDNLKEPSKPLQIEDDNKESSILNNDNKIYSTHRPIFTDIHGTTFDFHGTTKYAHVSASTSETDYINMESTTHGVTQKHPLHNTEDASGQSSTHLFEHTENLEESSYGTTEYIKDLIGQPQSQKIKKPFLEESDNSHKIGKPSTLNQNTHLNNITENVGAQTLTNKPSASKEPESDNFDATYLTDGQQYTTTEYTKEDSEAETFNKNPKKPSTGSKDQQTSQKYGGYQTTTTPLDFSEKSSDSHSTPSKPYTEKVNDASSSKHPIGIEQLEETKPEKPGWIGEQLYPQKKRPWLTPEEGEKTESYENYETTETLGVTPQSSQHLDQHQLENTKKTSTMKIIDYIQNSENTNKPDTLDKYPLKPEHEPISSTSLNEINNFPDKKHPEFQTTRPSSESSENKVSSKDKESNSKPELPDSFYSSSLKKPTKKNTTEEYEEMFENKVSIPTIEYFDKEGNLANVKESSTLPNYFLQNVKNPNQEGITEFFDISTEYPSKFSDPHKKGQDQYKPTVLPQSTSIYDHSQKIPQINKTNENALNAEQTTYPHHSGFEYFEKSTTYPTQDNYEANEQTTSEEISSTQVNDIQTAMLPINAQTSYSEAELYPIKKKPIKPSQAATEISILEKVDQITTPEKHLLVNESDKILDKLKNNTMLNPLTGAEKLGHTNSSSLPIESQTQNYATDYLGQKTTENLNNLFTHLSYPKEKPEEHFSRPQQTNNLNKEEFEKSTLDINILSGNDASTASTPKQYKPSSNTESPFKKPLGENYYPSESTSEIPQENIENYTYSTEKLPMRVDGISEQEKQPNAEQENLLQNFAHLTTASTHKNLPADFHKETDQDTINNMGKFPNNSDFISFNEAPNAEIKGTSIPPSLSHHTSITENQEETEFKKTGRPIPTRKPEDSTTKDSLNEQFNLGHEKPESENLEQNFEKPYFTTHKFEEASSDPIRKPYLPPELDSYNNVNDRLTTLHEHLELPHLPSSTYHPNKLLDDKNTDLHHSSTQQKETSEEPLTDTTPENSSNIKLTPENVELSTHKSDFFVTEDPEKIMITNMQNKEIFAESQSTEKVQDPENLIDSATHPPAAHNLFTTTLFSQHLISSSTTKKVPSSFYDTVLPENIFTDSTERLQHNKIQESSLRPTHFDKPDKPVKSPHHPEESVTDITDTKPSQYSTPKLNELNTENLTEEFLEKKTTQPVLPHQEFATSGLTDFPQQTSKQPNLINHLTTDSSDIKFTTSDVPTHTSLNLKVNLSDVQTRPIAPHENPFENFPTHKIEISSAKPIQQTSLNSYNDNLEQITADTQKHSSSTGQFSTPIYVGEPDLHVQKGSVQKIPEDALTGNFDTSSNSKFPSTPDSVFYTTIYPDQFTTTTFEGDPHENFENSFTKKNHSNIPEKTSYGDDLINKLHGIIQEIQTSKPDEAAATSAPPKTSNTDLFTENSEVPEHTSDELIHEGYTKPPLSVPHEKLPEIIHPDSDLFTEKPDSTTDLYLENFNQKPIKISTEKTETEEKRQNSTEHKFHSNVTPQDFTTEKLLNIKQEIISTTSYEEGSVTDSFFPFPTNINFIESVNLLQHPTKLQTNSPNNADTKSPNTTPSDSQFHNLGIKSTTEAQIYTSIKNSEYPQQPGKDFIKEDNAYLEKHTFKPDGSNEFDSNTDKHKPLNEENNKFEELQYFSKPSQSSSESTPQNSNFLQNNENIYYSQQKPSTELKPFDILDQSATTISNPDLSASTTISSHTLQNDTSKQSEIPSYTSAITNTTHLVEALTSTESYKKTTTSSALGNGSLAEEKYTTSTATGKPGDKISGFPFNEISSTDNGSSFNTVVVTPNVGNSEESSQFGTTSNPIHLVYPTYYPDGILPHKPVNESSEDQNDFKVQTSESSLDYHSQTIKTNEIPEIESSTEKDASIHQTEYTAYEIQTEISSESNTGRPVVIIEKIKTEVHSEKPTIKPSFPFQGNEVFGNLSEKEHSTEIQQNEFTTHKLSTAPDESEESFTDRVSQTQIYPSKEQIFSTKKPLDFLDNENKYDDTKHPFTQVTENPIQQTQQTSKEDHIMHLYSPKDKYKKTTTVPYHHPSEKTQTESPKQKLSTHMNSFHETSTDLISLITTQGYPVEENEKLKGSTQKNNLLHQGFDSEFQIKETTLRPSEIEYESIKTTATIENLPAQVSQTTDRPFVISQELSEPNFTGFQTSLPSASTTDNELLHQNTTRTTEEPEFIFKNFTIPNHHYLPEKVSENISPSGEGISYVPFKIVNGTKIYYPQQEQDRKPIISNDNKEFDGYDLLPYEIVNLTKVFYPEKVMSVDKPSSALPTMGMYVPYKIINGTKVYFTEDQPDNKDYDGLDYVPFEIVDGKKIFHTEWVTQFSTTTTAPDIRGIYIPYKVINGSRVFFPKDAQDDSKNIGNQYDGFQFIPHKLDYDNNKYGTTSNISSPHFQALYVPFKIRNNTKIYYPKDAEEKPLLNLKEYDGFDYIPFEIKNGNKVFYPEKGVPSYLAVDKKPYTTGNESENKYPQNQQSNFIPSFNSFLNKPVTAELPSDYSKSAMFVPYKLINGTKVFYIAEAQNQLFNVPKDYDGVEYVHYEIKNGTKVFEINQPGSRPFQVIFIPYKIVNGSKVLYPKDSSQKPLQSLPSTYDGIEYFLYDIKDGNYVFYSHPNKPFEQSDTKGMFVPYKIINGSKVFHPEDAENHIQYIPHGYDGFEFAPYEIKNGTKVFFITNKKDTNKTNLNESHLNGMYVPYKMINNTKVYYVNEAQNRPHPLSDEYHGLDYLPYSVINNTSNILPEKFNSKPEMVWMFVPFKLINGSKVHYPSKAQKEPQHISNQYDGYDYLLLNSPQNNVVFHQQEVLGSTTSQPIFKLALYVPYKISNGAKIFYPKDAQEQPDQIPHGYDGFEYIPYEIIDGKKVFHPEQAIESTSKPTFSQSLYVPYKINNGVKVYYTALAQNNSEKIPQDYDGYDQIPYYVVDGKKIFHLDQTNLTPANSPLGLYVPYKINNGMKIYYTHLAQEKGGPFPKEFDGFDYLNYEIVDGKKIFKPQTVTLISTPLETHKNALYVPFKIINGTKVFYPKDAQDKPLINLSSLGYDGFEYIPYDIVGGKKVFRPEEAIPFSEPVYIPYKIINGTKTYYPNLAKLKPGKVPEGYDGVDFIPIETLKKHDIHSTEGNIKPLTNPANLKYIFVPYKLVNGTKVFYSNEGKLHPQEIPQGYDGFEYVPYQIVDGKKVFYPEMAIESPPQISMPFLEGVFVPYKISNDTKIFYPTNAQENHQTPSGYDGTEYVPYENINGTKIFYPELISIPIPGAYKVYVPYKILNGKKVFDPKAASTEVPSGNWRPLYDGIAYVSYKDYSQHLGKPFIGTNSEVIYVDNEEDLSLSKNASHQYANYSIPGEGSCLLNNKTYGDNSEISSFNPCQVKCRCINSIIRCLRVKCPPVSHSNKNNCSLIYNEDSCCPINNCAKKPEHPISSTYDHDYTYKETIKPDSYLTTTENPPKKHFPDGGNDSVMKPYEKDNQYAQKFPKPNTESSDPYDNVEGLVSGEISPDEEYGDDDEPYGPGTCRYAGKIYVSAQQIPRDDPCDFCFCFRSDIICIQQSCPPPIPGCRDEPIHGFCCPRYECHVKMATLLNVTSTTTTTTTTLPPHFFSHAYKGSASRTGCFVQGKAYRVGQAIPSASGPCMDCICGGNGRMKCEPKVCAPEPLIRKMVVPTETTSSSSKRR